MIDWLKGERRKGRWNMADSGQQIVKVKKGRREWQTPKNIYLPGSTTKH